MREDTRMNGVPLCGWPWYRQHQHDYTQDYIDSLRIQVSRNGRKLPSVPNTREGKKVLKEVLASYRKER